MPFLCWYLWQTVRIAYPRSWQTFSVKDQRINILDSVGHMVFVTTTQLCCCSVVTNGHCCVSIKLYRDFLSGAVVKNPPASAGDTGSSPGPGRSQMPQSN